MQCIIPGIITSSGLEICKHRGQTNPRHVLKNSNETLGLFHLISGHFVIQSYAYTDFTKPPIGIHLEEAECPRPCSSYYTYKLAFDEANKKYDEDIFYYDFMAYFPTSELEEWIESDEYPMGSLFSEIGGALGLLLGSSVGSMGTWLLKIICKALQSMNHQ